MTAEQKIKSLIVDFIEKGRMNEDDVLDLQIDVIRALQEEEFPTVDFDDNVGEELRLAAEQYACDILFRIKKNQNQERTDKIVKKVLKKGREFLSRIKPTLETQ